MLTRRVYSRYVYARQPHQSRAHAVLHPELRLDKILPDLKNSWKKLQKANFAGFYGQTLLDFTVKLKDFAHFLFYFRSRGGSSYSLSDNMDRLSAISGGGDSPWRRRRRQSLTSPADDRLQNNNGDVIDTRPRSSGSSMSPNSKASFFCGHLVWC